MERPTDLAGYTLARTPRKTVRTKDITGGLPRVAELVEARTPKEAAEIAKIDGIVEFGGTARGKRKLVVRSPETGAEEDHGRHDLGSGQGPHVHRSSIT